MSISEDLARNLQRIRRERNMSLKDLSEELGIPMSSTEKYCSGTGNPRADTLDMLSETLKIPISEIITAHPPGMGAGGDCGAGRQDVQRLTAGEQGPCYQVVSCFGRYFF